ncbi:type IV pilus modification protein PilV [Polaromonas aquatica]|uniref:type IV pilus modification protein PilV n=1 Tax=Polaromonas aquatica TaxID=332657 RepID=UPI003D6487FB
MKLKNITQLRRHARGATLIEALVSILVLSLGLMGIAGLQLNAMAYQKSSWATHRVAELTSDIGERIRANPAGATNGNYTYTANYATAKTAAIVSNSCRTSGAACTTAQIANDDLSAWIAKAQTALPGGAVNLEGASNTGFTVTAMYMDKDFVNNTGVLQSSAVCTTATVGIAWRNCCPAAAATPAGVRCSRSDIIP